MTYNVEHLSHGTFLAGWKRIFQDERLERRAKCGIRTHVVPCPPHKRAPLVGLIFARPKKKTKPGSNLSFEFCMVLAISKIV